MWANCVENRKESCCDVITLTFIVSKADLRFRFNRALFLYLLILYKGKLKFVLAGHHVLKWDFNGMQDGKNVQ